MTMENKIVLDKVYVCKVCRELFLFGEDWSQHQYSTRHHEKYHIPLVEEW